MINYLMAQNPNWSYDQGWTMPAGGWNNQNAPRPQGLGVDALNAMAGQPGAASQHYGFSTDANSPYYILGDRYLGKLQSDWSKGITTGGNTQIHKILTGLGTSKTGQNQAFVKADPNLGSKFAQYFKTGDAAAAGITPARAKQAYDYALRATGVDAVKDRSPGLLGGLLKGNIGSIIGTVGGFALGGPAGAKIGGTLGGAAQGAYSGGFKGALTGGLSGYGIGSGGAWLGGKVAPGFQGAFPSSSWWSQAAAPIVGPSNPMPGSASALSGGGATSYGLGAQAGIPFATGSSATSSQLAQAMSGLGFTNAASPLSSVLSYGSGAGGGAGMGVFSGLLSKVPGFLANNAGSILQGGASLYGALSAKKIAEQSAKAMQEQGAFSPYNVDIPGLGYAAFSPDGSVTGGLSGPLADIAAKSGDLGGRYFDQLGAFDRNLFSGDIYDALLAQQAPKEVWDSGQVLEDVYNRGLVGGTGGNELMFNRQQQLEAADLQRRLSAYEAGAAEENRLANLYFKAVADQRTTSQIPLELAKLGSNLGQYDSSAFGNIAPFLSDIYHDSADQEAALWDTLGALGGRVVASPAERERWKTA